MKLPEEIRDEYVKKVVEFSYKKEEESKVSSTGEVRDRSNDIYVTDLCAWSTYCPKQIYYNKTAKRPAKPEALIRFTLGHIAHEIPLWDKEELNGHEQGFTWNGIKCRMDEIHFKDGIIVDKKTVASMPIKPKDYVVKQLNVYRIIAEENAERPTKINQLFILNIAVINGAIGVQEVPMWDKQKTLDFIENTTREIKYHLDNKIAPNVKYKSKGWICEGCQYTDLCMASPYDSSSEGLNDTMLFDGRQSVFSDDDSGGIRVRKGKK